MKRIPSWLTYTVLRLVLFAVPLVILLLLGIVWYASVIAAALIGLCLSYILLAKQRHAVASDLYAARHREKPAPSADDAEDEAIDAAQAEAATGEAHGTGQPASGVDAAGQSAPGQKA
ncbi:DUF4229 domain-containing protein [Microbacterium sp. X-17]|uniref:DUF4229 domain-containing protein n=1 Tax=Microbacterium sp. X-17 TaxID=3144404 RepID=UPI0031F5BAD8